MEGSGRSHRLIREKFDSARGAVRIHVYNSHGRRGTIAIERKRLSTQSLHSAVYKSGQRISSSVLWKAQQPRAGSRLCAGWSWPSRFLKVSFERAHIDTCAGGEGRGEEILRLDGRGEAGKMYVHAREGNSVNKKDRRAYSPARSRSSYPARIGRQLWAEKLLCGARRYCSGASVFTSEELARPMLSGLQTASQTLYQTRPRAGQQ